MKRQKIVIVAVSLFIPLLFASLGYVTAKIYTADSFSGLDCGSGKGYDSIAKGIAAYEAHNDTTIKEAVATIKSLPNYQKDPNCMYVVTIASIQVNNLDEAKKALTTFKKVYKVDKGLTLILGGKSVTLASLESKIATLEKANASAKANTFGSKGPKR